MDCARTSAAAWAAGGPDEVRAQLPGERDAHRRFEDWLVSRIDGGVVRERTGCAPDRRTSAAPIRRADAPATKCTGGSGETGGWTRIRVEPRGDVALVRLVDAQLVHESALAELRGELLALVTAGCARIVLNLAGVEHVSSQFLLILTGLDRACASHPGGRLKLCAVETEVDRIIGLCGLGSRLSICDDPRSALTGPWPSDDGHLPAEILAAVLGGPERPGVARPPLRADRTDAGGIQRDIAPVTLLIRRGGALVGSIRLSTRGVRIGRDARCQVRLGDPGVSRVHASLRLRDGHYELQDLGSSNGTIMEGRALRSVSASLQLGATFEIGPYRFELAPTSPADSPPFPCARGFDREPVDRARRPAEDSETHDSGHRFPTDRPVDPKPILRTSMIEGVLIISPTVPFLDEEAVIDRLRECLDALLKVPDPALRVVLDLAPLASLPGRAIGIIVSYLLRLRRLGGTLRIAQASPSVTVAMRVVGLPAVIESFATIDDAVLDRWPEMSQ